MTKNFLLLASLLKAYSIRKVIVSPGMANVNMVSCFQQDPFFEVYSSVDERSACYMACGMAAESGEPVVLSCTGATSSRNYLPGLTEAFYRKLPVLAVTSGEPLAKIGHLYPQVIDRTSPLNDVVKISVQIPRIQTAEDEWAANTQINKALLALTQQGGGPAHINLISYPDVYTNPFPLPPAKKIYLVTEDGPWPELKGKIAIFIGAHKNFSKEEEAAIENFCNRYNSVVFGDHTSNYKGKHSVLGSLIFGQLFASYKTEIFDTIIHLGEISGDYYSVLLPENAKDVWRVSIDGEIKDRFGHLSHIFQMSELAFFQHYAPEKVSEQNEISSRYQHIYHRLQQNLPELPFSNIWTAQQLAPRLPENSVLHLGILNSLRSWNFFTIPSSISVFSNVGGFGIDGGLSTLLGASLVHPKIIHFGVFGDLAFFYDMNALGNRSLKANFRVLLVNNGKGVEFRNFNHAANQLGDAADKYIAATGHFGSQSRALVKHLAEDLGFEYFAAENKQDFLKVMPRFLCPQVTDRPMLFEIFTDTPNESNALEMVLSVEKSIAGDMKQMAKKVLGPAGVRAVKRILRK